jgi:DNA-binding CsgD family transcriptional regulator
VEIFLFLTISVNVLLFAALTVWAIRYAVHEHLPRIKPLAWGLAVVATAFVLGAVTRLLLVGVRLGWLDGRVSEFVLSDWHLIQSLVATALGLTGLFVARRIGGNLRHADRIATAVVDRLPEETFEGLTPRELEVVEVLARGKLSDTEIAEELFISSATAGTHVKNILRKVGVNNRRDLGLIAASRHK